MICFKCDIRNITIIQGNSATGKTSLVDMIREFSEIDNYYVIITRESLHSLPYSVKEIYGIKNSGKYNYLKQTYHEFYNIYPEEKLEQHNHLC